MTLSKQSIHIALEDPSRPSKGKQIQDNRIHGLLELEKNL